MVALGVLKVVILGAPPESRLAERTRRLVAHLGQAHLATCATPSELARVLAGEDGPIWILRAGAMPHRAPAASLACQGTCLLGYTFERGELRQSHHTLETRTSGDFRKVQLENVEFDSFLVSAADVCEAAASGPDMDALTRALARKPGLRFAHVAGLDVATDARLRVGELVTSLHRGGAEQVFLTSVALLRSTGHGVLPLVLDRGQRSTLPTPPGTLHLYERGQNKESRLLALAAAVCEAGLDVVHAHLVDAEALATLRRTGIAVVVTVHNTRNGWPSGYDTLTTTHASLLLACGSEVAQELRATTNVPVRVLPNAISDSPAKAPRPGPTPLRKSLGVPDDALLLVSVANLRPQKRLDRVPQVIAALVARGRDAHALIVGEPLGDGTERTRIEKAIETEEVRERVHFLGARDDVPSILACADIFLSTSDYEGLSLAQLEAIEAGLGLVVTEVGGAREIWEAHGRTTAMELVSRTATRATYAEAVERVLASRSRPTLAPCYTTRAHGARLAQLLLECAEPPQSGLLLVTNNFATGGAQTSARRLLGALAAAGHPVAAMVIEENPRALTKGLLALRESGIPVHEARNAREHATAHTAQDVIDHVRRNGVRTVVFWNAIAEHKIRIADALAGRSIFDVSPGEMYFASLDRCFARHDPSLPYTTPRDYGALLERLVVKYALERAQGEHVLGTRVAVIPNGVPVPARSASPGQRGKLVIGSVARLSPDKKLEELLAAFSRVRHWVPNVELRILGGVDGMHAQYADRLRAEAPPDVYFAPETDGADAFLDDLDVFAMISEPAGCPNALLEAMGHGVPVVATDVGGAAQLVGTAGVITPRNAPEDLARALQALLTDEPRRTGLAAAGRARISESFSLARMRDAYAELFFPTRTSQ